MRKIEILFCNRLQAVGNAAEQPGHGGVARPVNSEELRVGKVRAQQRRVPAHPH